MSRRARMRAAAGWCLLALLALLPRLFAVQQYERAHPQAERLAIDELAYDSWARQLASGADAAPAVYFQEPLYAHALALVYAAGGDRPQARRWQVALGVLACLLTALYARELFGPAAGFLAGGLLALERAAIAAPCYLLKPNLVLPVLAALAWLLVRAGKRQREGRARAHVALQFAVGLLAGCGALLRGNVLLLLPLIAVWPLVRGRFRGQPGGFAGAAAGVLGMALVLLPVAVRNYVVGGAFVLTTSGAGTNVYGGNNQDNPYGTPREFDWVRGIPAYEADDWRREAERRLGRELDASATSRYWLAETGRSLVARPGMHARILWRKLRATLGAYEVPDNHDLDWDARYVPLLAWPWPGFAVAGVLLLAGMLAGWLPGRLRLTEVGASAFAAEAALLFLAYLATIVLTVTSMRVRLALLPLGLPFAGAWLVGATRALRAGATSAVAGALLSVALAAALVLPPVFPREWREERIFVREYNLATQLLDQVGDADVAEPEAERIARELAARFPDSSRVALLLAEVEWRSGRALARGDDREAAERGRELVRAALAVTRRVATADEINARERHRARRLAGWIQLDLGAYEAAARHFLAAREFDDEAFELRLGLVQAWLGLLEGATPVDPERVAAVDDLLRGLEREAPQAPALVELRARFAALQ